MTQPSSEATLAAVRDWYARLPAGVASLTQNETRYEQVIRITPAAVGASWVEFRIAPYGKMDVFFGHAGNHEEVAASPETAIEVCEAARLGMITEETRTWRGRRLSTLTVMHLPSGVRLKSKEILPLGLLPLGNTRRSHFAAWD
jgi:hypothetical protein